MRPLHTLFVVGLFALVASVLLASAGPLVDVTRKSRPQFIHIGSSRLKDGITKFDIVLEKDGEFAPHSASIELRDKGHLKLLAALVLYREPEKDEWRVVVHADEETIRQARIQIGYGSAPGSPPVSRNWSIPLAEFAKEEKSTTRPAA